MNELHDRIFGILDDHLACNCVIYGRPGVVSDILQLMCDEVFQSLNFFSEESIPNSIKYMQYRGFSNDNINASIDIYHGNHKNWLNFKIQTP